MSENVEMRLLSPLDKDVASTFVSKQILVDGTPIMNCLGFSEQEAEVIAKRRIEDALKNDKISSMLAFDKKNGNVIGCVLRTLCERQRTANMPKEENVKKEESEKLQIFFDFNRLIWSGVEEFLPDTYEGPFLRLDLALVDSNYRRHGVWKRMMEMSLERAYTIFGCRYAIGSCTTFKTQVYCEANGWRTLRWINYEDYFVLGRMVFDLPNASNDRSAKLMMADIEDWLANRKLV